MWWVLNVIKYNSVGASLNVVEASLNVVGYEPSYEPSYEPIKLPFGQKFTFTPTSHTG
jgi:hypothetical protein